MFIKFSKKYWTLKLSEIETLRNFDKDLYGKYISLYSDRMSMLWESLDVLSNLVEDFEYSKKENILSYVIIRERKSEVCKKSMQCPSDEDVLKIIDFKVEFNIIKKLNFDLYNNLNEIWQKRIKVFYNSFDIDFIDFIKLFVEKEKVGEFNDRLDVLLSYSRWFGKPLDLSTLNYMEKEFNSKSIKLFVKEVLSLDMNHLSSDIIKDIVVKIHEETVRFNY